MVNLVQHRKPAVQPSVLSSLVRTCALHGFYCLHFVGNSPSSRPLTDGQSCTAWEACCLAVCSAVCPMPVLIAYESHNQESLTGNCSPRTCQPYSFLDLFQGLHVGLSWRIPLLRHTRVLDRRGWCSWLF